MMKLLALAVLLSPSAVEAYSSVASKTQVVEIAVGNTMAKIHPSKARLARTGQKKTFSYTLFVDQLNGAHDAIQQVEFLPDMVDETYLPRSYTKQNGPPFATQHDCWGMSTARLLVTMRDGSVKTLHKRIRVEPHDSAKFRLVYKPYKVVTDRAFGVEMEIVTPQRPGRVRDTIKHVLSQESLVTGWNDKTMKAWKVETDNTIEPENSNLYGLEVVSPILRGEAGIDFIRKVANELRKEDATANKSCGLHVHVDLTGVDFAALKRICQNWIKYEHGIDLLLPLDRRGDQNENCLGVRDNMRFTEKSNAEAHELIAQQRTINGLAKLMNAHPQNRNRYFKLNLQNLVNKDKPRNTIEFRGYAGTCDPDNIEKWVRLVNAFVVACINKKVVVQFKDGKHASEQLKGFYKFVENP